MPARLARSAALARRPAWARPLPRLGLLGLVLALEVAWLRDRFTTDTLIGAPGLAAAAIRLLRFHAPWAIATLAAAVLLGGMRLRAEAERLAPALTPPRRAAAALAAHAAGLVLFVAATEALLAERPADGVPPALAAAWLAAGAATVGALALAAWPPAALARLARSTAPLLLAAGAIGLVVVALGRLLVAGSLWVPLSRGTVVLSSALLEAFTDAVVDAPEDLVVGTESFYVILTRECSGYEGMSLFLVFFAVFAAMARRRLRFPAALALLPLGVAAVYLCNAVRVALLVGVGTLWSRELALGGFHSHAGWILFSCVALGTVAVGTRVPAFARDPARPDGARTVNPAAAYLGPLLATIAAAMLAGAATNRPELLYPLRPAAALAVLWVYRRELPRLLAWSPAALLLGAGVYVVWLVAVPATADAAPPWAPAAGLPAGVGAAWLVARLVGYAAVTPVVEELAFRGYLQRRVQASDFEAVPLSRSTWSALLLPSLAFGALHGSFVAGTAAGLLLGLAALRRGRLGDAVLAHATANVLLLVHAAATGSWYLVS